MRCTQYRDLVVTLDPRGSGVRRIRIAVPRRKNAIRLDTYRHLAEALREADDDPHTKITLLTGWWLSTFLDHSWAEPFKQVLYVFNRC